MVQSPVIVLLYFYALHHILYFPCHFRRAGRRVFDLVHLLREAAEIVNGFRLGRDGDKGVAHGEPMG